MNDTPFLAGRSRLIPHFLSSSLLNQADKIMISRMVGDSKAGIYSVGYSAAMLLQIMISSVNASIIPWLYKKIKEGKSRDTRGVINLICFFMFGTATIFMLIAPECIWVLAPGEYAEAVWLFPPLTSSVFFIFIYNIFCDIELYYEKSIYVTVSSCIAAILNVALNYFLIPRFGYVVAGYTTVERYTIFGGSFKINCGSSI